MASAINCTGSPGEIDADSDIVGPGVLAAFFFTAVVTISAVVFAYFSDALDDSYLGTLDRKIISHTKRKWRHLRRVYTNLSTRPQDDLEVIRESRREMVTKFILALSDQQLVNGLAILLSGISDPNHLTGYEFTIVLGLAWFSSVTHLTTLTALRPYMDAHGLIRDARVVGMLILLFLLIYAMVVGIPSFGSPYPVHCILTTGNKASFSQNINTVGILALVGLLSILLFGYLTRLQDLYFNANSLDFLPTMLIWSLSHRGKRHLPLSEQWAEKAAERRLASLLKLPASTGLKRFVLEGKYLYDNSFLRKWPFILFGLVYGVIQISVFRWIPPISFELSSESNRFGFGQLLPLLLLLLPLMAAGESYYDYHNERAQRLKYSKEEGGIGSTSSLNPAVTTASAHGAFDAPDKRSEIGKQFDIELSNIRQFFSRDIRLEITEAPKGDDSLILRRKQALLTKYNVVTKFEKDINMTPAIIIYLLSTVGWFAVAMMVITVFIFFGVDSSSRA